MKNKLTDLVLKFYFFWKKRIIKCRDDISSILFFKLYEHAFELFPENTLKENSELAINVKFEILGLDRASDPEFTKKDQEKCLKKIALEDDSFLKQISYFYLLIAYYCSEPESESLNTIKNENLEKARGFIPGCDEISDKSFKDVYKSVKSELKVLKTKLRSISKNRIDQERLKLIVPTEIKGSANLIS